METGVTIPIDSKSFGLGKREVADILRERGINPTTQRTEIAHYLLQKPQHLSADEILSGLNAEYEQVSQATVYNTLRLFVDKKVIRELIFSPDRIYYDTNMSPHHHFVDVTSGQIVDIPEEAAKCFGLGAMRAEVLEVNLLVKGRLL